MARKFAIVTDTGCDLPDSYYLEHDVEKIRLGFTMDGVTYGEGETDDPDVHEFYERLRAGSMPKTFQITPPQAAMHIERRLKRGEDVLAVSFSSGLSGTCESYRAAAKSLLESYPGRKIFVVDSLCASLGQGLFVDYLVKKADSDATIEETVKYAESIRPHLCHIFTVEDLYHLKRGGRVSAATAVVGSLLRIKPVLHVDDAGHLIPIGKAMGRKKSISALVERLKETQQLGADDPLFISHGDCPEDVEYLKELLKADFGDRTIFVNEIGSVIGTHSGVGTLAVFFLGTHR